MDGIPGVTQDAVEPGTYWYHILIQDSVNQVDKVYEWMSSSDMNTSDSDNMGMKEMNHNEMNMSGSDMNMDENTTAPGERYDIEFTALIQAPGCLKNMEIES
ncbi:unnamed protein product, partial [Mesorhabditis spiculigera]